MFSRIASNWLEVLNWSYVVILSAFMVYVVWIFRLNIYCGKGVGVYAVLAYLPLLIAGIVLFIFRKKSCGSKNFWSSTLIVAINGVFIVFLIIVGVCFSCVNSCVSEAL